MAQSTESSLQLEIITPHGMVLSTAVDEVVAPSVNGEFGVLPGHLPLLAALQIGLLHYRKGGKLTDVAVGTGFAEVSHDKTIVLTDRYITRDDVDVLAVREKLKDIDEEIDRFEGDFDDPERLALIEEEQWLAAQLELYGDPPQDRVLVEDRPAAFSDVIPEIEEAPPADEL